jgi:hypothetical protein
MEKNLKLKKSKSSNIVSKNLYFCIDSNIWNSTVLRW